MTNNECATPKNINELSSDQLTILHKELDLLQSAITRMSQNSFSIKGWYFAIIVVVSAWKFNDFSFYCLSIGIISLIFYTINLQFYIYERRFREVYEERIELRCNNHDFAKKLYSMQFLKDEDLFTKAFVSKYVCKNFSLLLLYFGIAGILIFSNFAINSDNKTELKIQVERVFFLN
jgi:hypothetical protein